MGYGSRAYGWGAGGAGQAYGGAGAQNVASSTDAALTATTTRASIRDSVATAIAAITPSALSSRGFYYARHETADFRVWADQNDAATFRAFVVEFGPWEPLGLSDGLIQRRESSMTVIVAYPHHWALYQREGEGRRAMEDVIERDIKKIGGAVGIHGSANYPSGSCPKLTETVDVELGEGVSFASLEVMIEWYAEI